MIDQMKRRLGVAPMTPRDPNQPHRAASNLELLFDLVFVVAVSFSSAALHEQELEAHIGSGLAAYLAVFFAIWWAWMNFTWFATSFDPDDWLYRISTFVQMAGALIIAAGAAPAINDGDFRQVVIGYVVMRLVAVSQWVRVAAANPEYRLTATRYAVGITAVQVLWIVRVVVIPPGEALWTAVPIIVLELLVPAFAERARATPWHPQHITERFGCFTLIVLGESILASASAIVAGRDETSDHAALWVVAASGLVTIAAMWWVYFARDQERFVSGGLRSAMTFGYFHFLIFAAAGAFSAGVEVTVADLIDRTGGHESIELGTMGVHATFAVPVAVFFLGVWWLALRTTLPRLTNLVVLTLCAAMIVGIISSYSMVLTAVCAAVAALVVEVAPSTEPA